MHVRRLLKHCYFVYRAWCMPITKNWNLGKYTCKLSDLLYFRSKVRGLYQFTPIPFGVTKRVVTFQRAIDKFVEEENLTNTFVYLDNVTVAGRDQIEHNKCVKRFVEVVQRQKLILNDSKPILSADKISMLGNDISDWLVQPDKSRLQLLRDREIATKRHHLSEF